MAVSHLSKALSLLAVSMLLGGLLGPLPAHSASAAPAAVTVPAIGGSRLRARDMQTTRDEAVAAALVNAVSKVLVDTLDPSQLTARFALLTEQVLARTDRYVRDFRVVGEASQGNTYHVLLEATVALAQLKADLARAGLADEHAQSRVTLTVEGTQGRIADLVRFRTALGGVAGVANVQLQETTTDRALLGVDYRGDAPALAAALATPDYGNFAVHILEVGAQTIHLRLTPR